MSTNTLSLRSSGQIILEGFFNDFYTAFNGDFVGRNSSGVPTAGQNLGTVAFPWGTAYVNSMVLNGAAVDTSQITSPVNRVISGKKRSSSNQPAFIAPSGSALSFQVLGASTSLVYDVNGTVVTVSTDVTKSSLTGAPSTQNTALVNDTSAVGQHDTRLWGEPEHWKTITIDSAGSEITALVGKYAAFKIGSEYFFAFVKSSTELAFARRGFFYDSTIAPKNRSTFSDDDTITLQKLFWIFGDVDGSTIDVTYNNPSWSTVAPGSPVTGDYWYDLQNAVWKRYDGASFIIINRAWIGMGCNSTTACVAARSVDFYAAYSPGNGLSIEKSTTEIARASRPDCAVLVAGQRIYFGRYLPTWNITTDLASAADMYDSTEQNSRMYYLYVKDTGATVISDISPYFRGDLYGEYHPHNPWRCVGLAYNDSSGDLSGANDLLVAQEINVGSGSTNAAGSVATVIPRFDASNKIDSTSIIYADSSTNGASFTCFWPCEINAHISGYRSSAINLYLGWSLNIDIVADATTGIDTLVYPKVQNFMIGYAITSANASDASIGLHKRLKIGDVLRPHTDVGAGPTSAFFGVIAINPLKS